MVEYYGSEASLNGGNREPNGRVGVPDEPRKGYGAILVNC